MARGGLVPSHTRSATIDSGLGWDFDFLRGGKEPSRCILPSEPSVNVAVLFTGVAILTDASRSSPSRRQHGEAL